MKSLWIGLFAVFMSTANAQEVKDTYDFELFRPPADHYGILRCLPPRRLDISARRWIHYQLRE